MLFINCLKNKHSCIGIVKDGKRKVGQEKTFHMSHTFDSVGDYTLKKKKFTFPDETEFYQNKLCWGNIPWHKFCDDFDINF